MPTPDGPLSRSAAFHFSAMTSNARSQLMGAKSPSLSNFPFFMRSSGVVSLSCPYMIFERKYPLTQFTPRLTSACGSPCVATTLPSFTATDTPQPVPQKRQGAFDQRSLAASVSVMTFAAEALSGMPPAAAASAAADCRMNSRRVILLLIGQFLIDRVERRTVL